MRRSLFTVTTATADRNLLTIEELREAAGITDSESDEQLTALGLNISDRLARMCKLRADGSTPPSFLEETITEVWRRSARDGFDTYIGSRLNLSRRPLVSITSVTEDAIVLDSNLYTMEKAKGCLLRLDSSDYEYSWDYFTDKLTIVYVAGWNEVPPLLKAAAEALVHDSWQQSHRDLDLKEIEVPGVLRRVYNTGPSSSGSSTYGVPDEIMQTLGAFINYREG